MNWIERLRELGGAVSRGVRLYDVTSRDYDEREGLSVEHCGGLLGEIVEDIADQIVREHAEDCFRMGERAADVSMSAYDLLPQEEREAIAWVREHGGLDAVKVTENVRLNYRDALNGVCKRLGLTDGTGMPDMPEVIWTELDRIIRDSGKWNEVGRAIQDADNRRVELCGALGIDLDKGWSEAMAVMRLRLMPEGMEWLVEAWPRFEDGEPARFGEEAMGFSHKPPFVIDHVTLFDGGEATVCAEADHDSGKVENFVRVLPGERVKRPAPKVLDADGAEIREGDEVYAPSYGFAKCKVLAFEFMDDGILVEVENEIGHKFRQTPDAFTHRAPVLAADGKPLREGEMVYHTAPWMDKEPRVIERLEYRDGGAKVWFGNGKYEWPENLTHERPDSWERLEEDAGKNPFDYCKDVGHRLDTCENSEAYKASDLVRRARALAGEA